MFLRLVIKLERSGWVRVRPLSYPILVHPPPFTTLAGKALQTHPTLYHYPTQEHSIKMEEEKIIYFNNK